MLRLFLILALAASAAAVTTEDLPVGYLPLQWVTASLKKTLSPAGHYRFVTPNGPVRITDEPEKIESARASLEALLRSPALVQIQVEFITIASRDVTVRPSVPPTSMRDGIRVPSRYTTPQLIPTPGGGVIAIPSQPRILAPHRAEQSEAATAMTVRKSETRITRRLSANGPLGRPLIQTLVRQAASPDDLRLLALKLRAIPATEPNWPLAGTELLIETSLSNEGALELKIVPQIVVPSVGSGLPMRRIPLIECTGPVSFVRGTQTNTGLLPNTDLDFHRLFLATPQLEKDSTNALRVTASLRYIGAQAR